MFTYTPVTTPVNYCTHCYSTIQDPYQQFFDLIQAHREQELRRQQELRRPRIVKKIETEDKYQIQIFKEYGNFNSYEVSVLKKPRQRVHIVITSEEDEFQKIFEFNISDIEVQKIDWEYYASEKVLVLNIPKQIPEPEPTFYSNPFFNFIEMVQQQQRENKAKHNKDRGHEKALEYKRRAELAKQKAQKKKQEAERRKQEAERKRLEEQRKQEAERRRLEEQRKQEAERKRLEEEEQRRKDEIARQIHEKAEAKRREEAKRQAKIERKQQEEDRKTVSRNSNSEASVEAEEVLKQLFGVLFGGPVQLQTQCKEVPQVDENEKEIENTSDIEEKKEEKHEEHEVNELSNDNDQQEHEEDLDISDNESINSEVETPPASPSPKIASPLEVSTAAKITRQPSLEEVEDEEFVMFKKKFGQ